MKITVLSSISIILLSCSNFQSNVMEKKAQTIELEYIAWACECANWTTPEDIEKFSNNEDSLASKSIFIEPANNKIELPDTLCYNGDRIKFTGQFYVEKGFPKGYESEQNPEKAKVFRYTEYEVVKSNYNAIKK